MYARPTLLAVLIAGCDGESLTAQASLEVEPPAIDFGKVPAGKTRSVDLLLRSRTRAAVEIASIGIAEGSAPVFSIGEAPVRIEGGQEARVRITYAPDDAEPDAGHVAIESNAIDAARVLVPLTSARTFPAIRVRPSELDLGSLLSGGEASGSIAIESAGDATLEVTRASLRTVGFQGEACTQDGDCREGRCTLSRSGRICALPCDSECPAGYACTVGGDGYRGCREDTASPPTERRGFVLSSQIPLSLLPEASTSAEIAYRPAATDRGSVTLVIESNDPERPLVPVPLFGLLENLPPVASAAFESPPGAITPGARIAITGRDSYDPEGDALEYRWRFVSRPEGSRAAFEDDARSDTAFTIDRPGPYTAALEVRDASGLGSTNDARLELTSGAGERVRLELTWDRGGTDLDLHLVSPGAPVGSLGDCFYDNPRPDWSEGDPLFTSTSSTGEAIEVQDHGDGVYTILVDVVAPSPQGPTGAALRLFLDDVEVAAFDALLPTSADAWDVATLSWPSGRIVALDTVR